VTSWQDKAGYKKGKTITKFTSITANQNACKVHHIKLVKI
jgi:hypothetical protein